MALLATCMINRSSLFRIAGRVLRAGKRPRRWGRRRGNFRLNAESRRPIGARAATLGYVSQYRSSGFTLVETALALGIVSFALVALMGTMPVGLQASRTASDVTITALIGERLTGLIQQTGWSNYPAIESSYYYFDSQGDPLTVTSAGHAPAGSLYTASILPVTPITPAGTGNLTTIVNTSTVAWLQITIVNDPTQSLQGAPPATPPATLPPRSTVIPVFLADNGG